MSALLVSIFLFLTPFFYQVGQLAVRPTPDPEVFNIIYKGDMKWHVVVKLYNEKGKKRLEQEVKDSDGFILPISLKNEKSGTYLVEISTPAYDLREEFNYVSKEDILASLLQVGFNKERSSITVSSEENVDTSFGVYIFNERGDQLVFDDVQPQGGKVTRIYNLKGAPATSFRLVVMVSGIEILRQTFE